ncbi:hypothetical protein BC827DRAFT_1229353 [Russula dissimulans]|nr:hypothetical protein BC827DRAFT_1229353 [Russula dissimulans]
MAKPDKKTEKRAEKKITSAPKTEAKAKASKKAVDGKKTVSTVPSAKHSAPISSKEILAQAQHGNKKKGRKDESSSDSSSEDDKPASPVNGKAPTTKTGTTKASSSSESSDSDSEESPRSVPKVIPKTAPSKTLSAKEPNDGDSDEDSDSEDADEKPPIPAAKAAPLKAGAKGAGPTRPTVSTSATVKALPAKATLAKVTAVAASSSSEESSSEESSEEESSEEESFAHKNAPTKPVTAKTPASKPVPKSTDSVSESDSDEDESSDPEPGVTKDKKESESESEESASDSKSSSEDDEQDKDVEMADATAASASAPTNGKRKADTEAAVPPKKKKLANDDAASVNDDTPSLTVFVGRLSWNVDNDWLKSEFEECGEVVAARVQMDRNTGRSRGFAYVEFADPASVEKALQLSGKEIDGRPINVDRSTSNKGSGATSKPNDGRRAAYGDKTSPPSSVLFVGNLSWSATEDSLWDVFAEYGDVKNVRVPTDRESGKVKGFGYVEFFDIENAKKAHEGAQNMELLGRNLRLDFSQPRDGSGSTRGGPRGGGRGFGRGGGRGGFGFDGGRGGRGGGGRGGFASRGRGRGGGARTGGITQFEGKKVTFD